MREYDLVHSHVYPVAYTCMAVDALIEAAEQGDLDMVRQLAEKLREENATLRHNAASWEYEARKARVCVDASPDTPLRRMSVRARTIKEQRR